MASPSRALSAACLGDDTLAAVLEGALPEHAARQAREHLGTCDGCRRLVSAVLAKPVAPTTSSGALDETVVQTAVPGALIGGKYRVERLIGAGGMGQVFAAQQLDLGRPVALKVLRPGLARDPVALSRFAREARVASGLISDGTVRVYELGRLASGEPYLVMELLEGEDLGAVVARGPVPIERALSWMISVCEAIADAHALGIVHRDIKPQNVFVARRGGGERIKVLDFGLAKLAASEPGAAALTAEGVAVGSPLYMAPEQLVHSASADARSDVWALGVTLFHLLAGAPPFGGESLHELVASVRDRPAPSLLTLRPAVGPAIASVVARCLSKDPAGRFASVKELAGALRASRTAAGTADGVALTSGAPTLLAGRYELCEQLGAGGARHRLPRDPEAAWPRGRGEGPPAGGPRFSHPSRALSPGGGDPPASRPSEYGPTLRRRGRRRRGPAQRTPWRSAVPRLRARSRTDALRRDRWEADARRARRADRIAAPEGADGGARAGRRAS